MAGIEASDAARLERARGLVTGWQAAARKRTRKRLRKAWAAYRKLRA